MKSFDEVAGSIAEPDFTALADIGHVLHELRQLWQESEPHAGKIRRRLQMLQVLFEDLTANAQTLTERLERKTGFEVSEAKRLIDCAERFIGELVLATDSIGDTIRDVDASIPEGSIAAEMEAAHWEVFRNWFISQPGRLSNAEMLRERVRASIPALLGVIARINDRRLNRIDRSHDFRVLARWFAEAKSDAEAHRLWRMVFGLCPARHLIINDATLDDYEAQDVPANTSWIDGPPLRISPRHRESCSNLPTGGLNRIIDRTVEKEKLAEAIHEDALRILSAQGRFGTGRRMRLSELEHMEMGEFDLFLDLLGEAISVRVFPAEPVEIVSGDGCLKVKLEPTGDGRQALILTTEGSFSGPDHWISIEPISPNEKVEVIEATA